MNNMMAMLASAVIIGGGLAQLARAIFRAVLVVRDNTAATEKLSGKFDVFAADTAAKLADYGERLTKLEGAP